jgi:magnesium-transporting ATPase (P-type)
LVGLDQDTLYQSVDENIIFNHVTSEQTSDFVISMREHGETVAVFGGNPSDIQIMKNANLSITSQGSSQAALSTADIILLREAPKALLTVMEKGQSIVRSLLDVLKLYLTQLAYLTTLILALWALDLGFPYLSQQGSFIAIVTLTLPSLALSLWELPGALKQDSLSRQLLWFVGPAALSISLSGILVYTYFLKQTNQMAYAQLALTHMLVISGLLLFVMVRPPKRSDLQDTTSQKNWRTVILAMGLLIAYLLFASLPIAFRWFRLAHLRQPGDYLVIGFAVLAWAVLVQIIRQIFSASFGIRAIASNIKQG